MVAPPVNFAPTQYVRPPVSCMLAVGAWLTTPEAIEKLLVCAWYAPGAPALSAQMAILACPVALAPIKRNSCRLAVRGTNTGTTHHLSLDTENADHPSADASPTAYGVLAAQLPAPLHTFPPEHIVARGLGD